MTQPTMILAISCLMSACWLVPAALADESLDRLSAEVRTLKAGQEAIQKDLQVIKKLLESLSVPKQRAQNSVREIDVILNVAKDPHKGDLGAPVTLVEFTDYQCPYCRRHLKNVMPQIEKNFVDTGKIRYVLRDFPLDFHPLAAKAHVAAHCAAEQGRYWEMHEQLFEHQKELQPDKLPGYAETAGVIDIAVFEECLTDDRYARRGKKSAAEGAKAGVTGTPSFLLGPSGLDGRVKATKFIRGAQGYTVFEKQINEMLASLDSKAANEPKVGVDDKAKAFADSLQRGESDPVLLNVADGTIDLPFCITPRLTER